MRKFLIKSKALLIRAVGIDADALVRQVVA